MHRALISICYLVPPVLRESGSRPCIEPIMQIEKEMRSNIHVVVEGLIIYYSYLGVNYMQCIEVQM